MYIHHVTSDQKVFNKPVMLGLGVGSQRMERINSKNENIHNWTKCNRLKELLILTSLPIFLKLFILFLSFVLISTFHIFHPNAILFYAHSSFYSSKPPNLFLYYNWVNNTHFHPFLNKIFLLSNKINNKHVNVLIKGTDKCLGLK